MGFWQKLFKGGARHGRLIRAKYDAAQTNADNARHWANADALSADMANSASIRKRLRDRARYEIANNTYARGLVKTIANDVIGTGPRLQMRLDNDDSSNLVEKRFGEWARRVQLARKLRVMREARIGDGEAFAVLVFNPNIAGPVKLDLRLVEADQVSDPSMSNDPNNIDGIVLDQYGNPLSYNVLRNHPGGNAMSNTADNLPADQVIHWFRADRPGQHRGVPEITAALPLFAQLRRYTLAVLGAAENAANFSGILHTDTPAGGEAMQGTPFEEITLERNQFVTLPDGWEITQLVAGQPTTTYPQFKAEILKEIARGCLVPFNVAAGDSSGYNYASGRLDHLTYFKSIGIDQEDCESGLDKIFAAWVELAILVENYLPQEVRNLDSEYPHEWFWDGNEHVDPTKEADADSQELENGSSNLAIICGKRGRDWREVAKQRKIELAEIGAAPATDQRERVRETAKDANNENE